MLKIFFKNMESSQLAKEFVQDRLNPIIEKFPSLKKRQITLYLEMEKSFQEVGPDLFTVRSIVSGKTFNGLEIKRSSGNFFQAITELADELNQLLSRELDH